MTARRTTTLAGALAAALLPAAAQALDCADWNKPEAKYWVNARPADVSRCLAEGADPNWGGEWPPLSYVASVLFRESPDAAATRALLAAGADPDARDRFSRTALHYAVGVDWLGWRRGLKRDKRTTIAVVKALLGAGADPNAATVDPWADQRHGTPPSVVSTLRKSDAGVFLRVTRQAWTPLMLAVKENEDPEIVRLMLAHGGDPDIATKGEDWTSLHIAAWAGNPDVIRLLLDAGADPRAVTAERRWTPMHVLAFRGKGAGRVRAGQLLVEAGVDLAARDSRGRTAWDMIAARFSAAEIAAMSPASRRALAKLKAGSGE